MVLNLEEVSLNIRPKRMSDLFGDISNVSDKIDKLDDIIKRLEDEMIKIDAFKRQLPLTVLLINDGWCLFFKCCFVLIIFSIVSLYFTVCVGCVC